MGRNDSPNEVEHDEADPTPNKILPFKLNGKSNNAWALDPHLANCANRFMEDFAPSQTLTERV